MLSGFFRVYPPGFLTVSFFYASHLSFGIVTAIVGNTFLFLSMSDINMVCDVQARAVKNFTATS